MRTISPLPFTRFSFDRIFPDLARAMPVVTCSKCGTRNRVDPRRAAEQMPGVASVLRRSILSKAENAVTEGNL